MMTDLNKKNFYREVLEHLEEVEELFDEHDFDLENYSEDDGAELEEHDALVRFINLIRDAKNIAEENS